MTTVAKLEAQLTADTRSFDRSLDHAHERMRGAGEAMKVAGAAIAGGLVVAGVAAYKATQAASKFQSEMELIQTQAGASTKEVKTMSAAILGLAGRVGQTPEELAKGLYHIESSGFRGAKALNILKTAAEGAAVGHTDLESVTNALVAAQHSGIKGMGNMSHAMGALNAVVGAGNMRMEDLTASLSTGILPAAKTFGLSLKDVGGALAAMTRNGVPAVDAATRLRMTFSLIAAPTSKAAGEFKKLHLGTLDLANAMRSGGGILGALTMLKEHLDASGLSATNQADLLSKAFGGGRSSSAILTLLGNLKDLKSATDAVSEGTKSFGENWKETQQSAEFAGKQFHAAFSALEIEIGSLLLPAFTAITREVTKMIVFIQANMPTIKRVAREVFADINVAWETVLKPVLIGIVGSVVLTVQAVQREWPKIRAAAEAVVQWYNDNLKPTITAVLEYLRAFWARWGDDITNTTKRIFGILWTVVKPLMVVLRDTIEVILALIRGDWGKAWDSLKDLLKNAFDAYVAAIKGYVSLMFSAAKALGQAIVDGIIEGVKAGAGALKDAVVNVAKDALSGAAGFLGIHSPSELTKRELGEPIAAGIAQGILSGKNAVSDALVQTMQGVLDAAKARVGARFGEFSSWVEHAFGAAQAAAMARLEKRIERDQAGLTAKVAAAQAKISAFGAAQTPAEKELAALQEEHAAAGRDVAVKTAQAQLAGATTPEEVAAAQAQLDEALYQQRIADLEKIAATERQARDDETARRQANLDAQTAQEQAAFDKRAEAQRAALTEAQWEEQQHFQARLANLSTYLESGHATVKGARQKILGFLAEFGVQASSAAELLGGSFAQGLRNMIPDIVQAAQAISTALENEGIITKGRKITITIEENAKKAAKKRAGGGPVTKGQPYLVGEIGPELFVPAMSGAIVPSSTLAAPAWVGAGGGEVHFHFDNYVGSKQDLMRWLRDAAAIFKQQNGRAAF